MRSPSGRGVHISQNADRDTPYRAVFQKSLVITSHRAFCFVPDLLRWNTDGTDGAQIARIGNERRERAIRTLPFSRSPFPPFFSVSSSAICAICVPGCSTNFLRGFFAEVARMARFLRIPKVDNNIFFSFLTLSSPTMGGLSFCLGSSRGMSRGEIVYDQQRRPPRLSRGSLQYVPV